MFMGLPVFYLSSMFMGLSVVYLCSMFMGLPVFYLSSMNLNRELVFPLLEEPVNIHLNIFFNLFVLLITALNEVIHTWENI